MRVLRPAPVSAAPSARAEDAGGGSLRTPSARPRSSPPQEPLPTRAPQLAGPRPRSRDADLVAQVRAGSDAAQTELLDLHRPLVNARVRSYFLVGADRDDVVQEALIGLFKAIRDFDPDREVSFRTFADVCVTRQIVSAVRTATRHKHGPLNDYQSLGAHGGTGRDGVGLPLEGLLPSAGSDPADLVVSKERLQALQCHVDQVLSDFEVRVLSLHLEGRPQADIAAQLHRSSKSVDNALQRIKRKLSAHLAERTLAEAG